LLAKTHTVYTYAMDNDLVHIFYVFSIFIGLLAIPRGLVAFSFVVVAIPQVLVAFSFVVVAIRNDLVAIVHALYK